jgi:hypothetical protein
MTLWPRFLTYGERDVFTEFFILVRNLKSAWYTTSVIQRLTQMGTLLLLMLNCRH